jgi:hypothetical protein
LTLAFRVAMTDVESIMPSPIAKLRSLIEELEAEAARAANGTNVAMQPEKAAELKDIHGRIAKLKADLLKLGDIE